MNEMKAVILAGGLGTRLSEETNLIPKPMVRIGEMPIIWHIMKLYSSYGINEFIICCGYKGHAIKDFFINYLIYNSDITVNTSLNDIKVHQKRSEPWKVTLCDTGQESMTGGRIKRIKDHLDQHEPFCLTYGDGLSDVNIKQLIKFHKDKGKLATLTSVSPPGRFGSITLNEDNFSVTTFKEKPKGDGSRINGGFFVLSPKVIDFIEGDHTSWEEEPMETLAKEDEIVAFKHDGFWQPMDTLRDKRVLEELWLTGKAPWKVW